MQKKEGILDHMIHAVFRLKENPSKLVYSILLDLFFFIVFGAVLAFFSERIMYNIYRVSSLTAEFSQGLGLSDAPNSFIDMISRAGAMPFFKSAIINIVLFSVFVYAIYCLFHGSAWYFSAIMAKSKKMHYFNYLKDFSLISILWFTLFVIYNILLTLLDYAGYVPKGYSRLYFLAPFFLFFSYFAILSYAAIGNMSPLSAIKNSFIQGVFKARYFFLFYITVLLVCFIMNMIFISINSINETGGLIIGIILFFSSMTWARISVKTLFGYVNKRFK